jgi:hypothetical protein
MHEDLGSQMERPQAEVEKLEGNSFNVYRK